MFLFFTLCFVKYYSFFRDSLKWLGLKKIDVFLECMQDLWFHKPCSRGFSFTQVTFLLPHICGFMNASIFTWGKYMATVVQMSDLNSNEIEWLANHLGHDVDIYQEYYRLYDNATELSKVSRLLLAVDSGKGEAFKGKRLDEIQIDGMTFFIASARFHLKDFIVFTFC